MAHRFGGQVPPRTKGVLAALAAVLGVATAIGIVVLRPSGGERPNLRGLGFTGEVYEAEVVAADLVPCQGQPEEGVECRRIAFELREGPDAGRTARQEFVQTASAPDLAPGDDVLLARDPQAAPGFEYRFVDRDRGVLLFWLAAAFGLAVVALGRLRGVAALAGLAVSIGVLLWFVLPSILDGRNPLAVALVGSAAIAFLALYLAHGFSTMTTVALLGTLGSLALTAVLANVFVGLAAISGFASEEAVIVQLGAARIDLAGIVLGGVVIGALGAIDDMTVTQASAVWELQAANPRMGRAALAGAGMRIGRNHVASTVNTLALAYAGASMPVLLLLILSRQPLTTVASGEVIATEIVRTLVGSIGLVAAVPLTTWLAAWAAPQPRRAAEDPG
ncbi:MAG TPA: YibE/F family protein [Actinomycetota bacterium]|nr:YibE/F family protein [Actinomycetota bacterium]